MKMQNSISEILNKIPKERVFDSHYVISQLIKYHSDVYLTFASGIEARSRKTPLVHGHIGKEIAKFEKEIAKFVVSGKISRITNKSRSENIHGNSSPCTAWEKL